jgi:hypothetical protein
MNVPRRTDSGSLWRAFGAHGPGPVHRGCDDWNVSLLREIQAAAIDEKTSVTTLLLKCQLLAARVSHDEFARWVDFELNGYPPGSELPEYRRQGLGRAVGTFSGFGGSSMNGVTLSMSPIAEKHRDTLFNVDLRQPASALEDLATSHKASELAMPWPGDFIAHYGRPDIFVEGMALIGARTVVPKAAIVAALSTIRSRVLSVATEIERAAPDAGDGLAGADPLPRKVRTAMTNNIYGSSVALGGDIVHGSKASVSAGGDAKNTTVTVGLEESGRHWFTRHPWWSALIVGALIGAPGTYLAIFGPHIQ